MHFSKASIATAAVAFASVLGAVSAQPVHHHHMHKRDDVVTNDVYVVLKHVVDANGNLVSILTETLTSAPTEVVSAPAAASTPVSVEAASTSTPAVVAAPSSSTPAAQPSPSSSAAAAPSSSASPSSPSTISGPAKGMVYSPYDTAGCKSASQIQSELAPLSDYGIIRLYGTDCSQIQNVKAALAPGQKLFLGVFYMDQLEAELQALISAIGGDWDVVDTISIGNELVNDGEASVEQIGQYVATARPILAAAGYTGPVVAVDTFIAVINNPGLCAFSDYIAVNAHAYYDGTVDAAQAGEWVVEQIQRVWTACGGSKSVVITETGWPHQGQSNGAAVASSPNQQTAIAAIKQSAGNDCILFSAYDELWESPGEFGVQPYFGILSN